MKVLFSIFKNRFKRKSQSSISDLQSSNSIRILVVRRDNIGDLICTTPLLHGLRQSYPNATIAVLASSYNAAVLEGNPDVDEVFIFLKRHQKTHGYGFLSMLWNRWQLVRTIRRRHFDAIILANGGWRYARHLGGKKLIGFREQHQPESAQPDVIVPLENEGREDHEVSKMACLGMALGVMDAVGPVTLFPDEMRVQKERQRLQDLGWDEAPQKPTIALHMSTRRFTQRWPKESFVALAQALIQQGAQLLLFWSPGKENDPMHPGDDDKAAYVLEQLRGLPAFPCPTKNLQELVASVALADQMICSDGGGMHVAAALKKPILCFFGTSFLKEWHPWKVPYIALQPNSRRVVDISVEEALEGFERLVGVQIPSFGGRI